MQHAHRQGKQRVIVRGRGFLPTRTIRKLWEDKIAISEKIANCGRPLKSFDETLRTALDFLGNPRKLWDAERLEDRRALLKLAFIDQLAYVRNEGFRTANLALPFKVFADFSSSKSKMARPERLIRIA
jgi:hypothetical protein